MELTKEMMEKAKAAKSAAELLELAKAEGIEMTAEEAEMRFAELNKKGELSDEELDNVSGGGCGGKSPRDGNTFNSAAEVTYKHAVGDRVEVKFGVGTVACKILAQGTDSGVFTRARYTKYYATYKVEAIGDPLTSANWFGGTRWINEVDIDE